MPYRYVPVEDLLVGDEVVLGEHAKGRSHVFRITQIDRTRQITHIFSNPLRREPAEGEGQWGDTMAQHWIGPKYPILLLHRPDPTAPNSG